MGGLTTNETCSILKQIALHILTYLINEVLFRIVTRESLDALAEPQLSPPPMVAEYAIVPSALAVFPKFFEVSGIAARRSPQMFPWIVVERSETWRMPEGTHSAAWHLNGAVAGSIGCQPGHCPEKHLSGSVLEPFFGGDHIVDRDLVLFVLFFRGALDDAVLGEDPVKDPPVTAGVENCVLLRGA